MNSPEHYQPKHAKPKVQQWKEWSRVSVGQKVVVAASILSIVAGMGWSLVEHNATSEITQGLGAQATLDIQKADRAGLQRTAMVHAQDLANQWVSQTSESVDIILEKTGMSPSELRFDKMEPLLHSSGLRGEWMSDGNVTGRDRSSDVSYVASDDGYCLTATFNDHPYDPSEDRYSDPYGQGYDYSDPYGQGYDYSDPYGSYGDMYRAASPDKEINPLNAYTYSVKAEHKSRAGCSDGTELAGIRDIPYGDILEFSDKIMVANDAENLDDMILVYVEGGNSSYDGRSRSYEANYRFHTKADGISNLVVHTPSGEHVVSFKNGVATLADTGKVDADSYPEWISDLSVPDTKG